MKNDSFPIFSKLNVTLFYMDRINFFIEQYKTEDITINNRLYCYNPEYIPSIGEFTDLKVDPPQKINRKEPTTKPMNTTILQYQLKNKTKYAQVQTHFASDSREIAQFVNDSSHLSNNSAVVFGRNIPDEESLLSAWNREIEQFLSLNRLKLDTDLELNEVCEVAFALLGIPFDSNNRSKIEGLYALFNLYSDFTQLDHFK
eukprot:NODE_12_length_45166_cov_0.552511.p16 type:complete len:201 gc:universal NODE_12_length_45166_cov_0.552511:34135-34737(+)